MPTINEDLADIREHAADRHGTLPGALCRVVLHIVDRRIAPAALSPAVQRAGSGCTPVEDHESLLSEHRLALLAIGHEIDCYGPVSPEADQPSAWLRYAGAIASAAKRLAASARPLDTLADARIEHDRLREALRVVTEERDRQAADVLDICDLRDRLIGERDRIAERVAEREVRPVLTRAMLDDAYSTACRSATTAGALIDGTMAALGKVALPALDVDRLARSLFYAATEERMGDEPHFSRCARSSDLTESRMAADVLAEHYARLAPSATGGEGAAWSVAREALDIAGRLDRQLRAAGAEDVNADGEIADLLARLYPEPAPSPRPHAASGAQKCAACGKESTTHITGGPGMLRVPICADAVCSARVHRAIDSLFGYDEPSPATLAAITRDEGAGFDLAAFFDAKFAWSRETFGPGARTKTVTAHIRKELLEVEADPADVIEWVDVVLIAMDGAARSAGVDGRAFVEAMRSKQAKCETRTYPDWRTIPEGTPIEHVRTRDEGGATDARELEHEAERAGFCVDTREDEYQEEARCPVDPRCEKGEIASYSGSYNCSCPAGRARHPATREVGAPAAGIRLAGLASIADDIDRIVNSRRLSAPSRAELHGIAIGLRAASVPVAPVREAGAMTVGKALLEHGAIEWFADGQWQQFIPRSAVPWRFWCAPSDRGPGGWSPWQPRALSGIDYTAPCRLVPLATADAPPESRGPIEVTP